MKKIQMQVSEKVWNYLHRRKQINETFDDVLQRELKLKREIKWTKLKKS